MAVTAQSASWNADDGVGALVGSADGVKRRVGAFQAPTAAVAPKERVDGTRVGSREVRRSVGR